MTIDNTIDYYYRSFKTIDNTINMAMDNTFDCHYRYFFCFQTIDNTTDGQSIINTIDCQCLSVCLLSILVLFSDNR